YLKQAAYVDGEHPVPFVERKAVQVFRLPRGSGAGVIDQNIEAPEGLVDRIEHRADTGFVGHVALDEQDFRAELFGFARGVARRRFGGVVVDRYVVAGADQREHGAFADAGRTAGDESNFSGRHAVPALRWD